MSDSLLRVKTADDLRLWVPDSYGRDKEAEAQKAVKEYDEGLMLARHEHTGDWCVFLQRGPFGDPYPVVGLGPELPHPDDIKKTIYKYDAVRHGDEILAQINRHNDAILAEKRTAADDAAGVVAEAQESFLHDQGQTRYRRVLRPVKKTAVRGH